MKNEGQEGAGISVGSDRCGMEDHFFFFFRNRKAVRGNPGRPARDLRVIVNGILKAIKKTLLSQSPYENADHGNLNHRFAVFRENLIIL